MLQLERFLRELDDRWVPLGGEPIRLTIIGSAALTLQTSYERGTKDSDVLETSVITLKVAEQLKKLGGRESTLATRHRLYIDVVRSGLPFLPHKPRCHEIEELSSELLSFDVEVLDVVDVVVSKLKRFNSNDRGDIDAMIERELVPHEHLVERFKDAVDFFSCDDRANDLPQYVEHLHYVEREMLGLAATPIDLPDWI